MDTPKHPSEPPTIPLRRLLDELKVYANRPDHWEVSFCGLTFCQVKTRGDDLIQIEFEEPVYRDDSGQVIVESP